jgi:hypothetical protein
VGCAGAVTIFAAAGKSRLLADAVGAQQQAWVPAAPLSSSVAQATDAASTDTVKNSATNVCRNADKTGNIAPGALCSVIEQHVITESRRLPVDIANWGRYYPSLMQVKAASC